MLEIRTSEIIFPFKFQLQGQFLATFLEQYAINKTYIHTLYVSSILSRDGLGRGQLGKTCTLAFFLCTLPSSSARFYSKEH